MNKKQKIIYIYFIILPFLDVITSLITRFASLPLSPGMIIKGLTAVFSVIYLFIWSKSNYKKKSIQYIIMLAIFVSIYFLTKPDIWSLGNIANELITAFRYLYFPIMIIGIVNIFDDLKIDNDLIKKILLINCLSYTALLLIPYVTNTGFNSYRWSGLEGQNGWFYAANETGAICVLLLSSVLSILSNKNKWSIILVIPILLSIVLIGTKVSYLGMILATILLAITVFIKEKRKRLRKPIFLLVILFVLCSFSPAISNLEGKIDKLDKEETKKEEIDKYIFKYDELSDLTDNETLIRIATLALNGRDSFFLKNYSIYLESPVQDKLFGLGWSNREKLNYTFEKKLIEIDYIDIFIHYGIIGFMVYFLPLVYFFKDVFIKRKRLNIESLFYTILLLLVIAISSFSGHIFAAPAVSIYIVLTMVIINNYLHKEINLKDNEITILALHLGYGGIEKYIASLCKILKDDYKIKIITTYKLQDNPAFTFDKEIDISYLIDDSPNKMELINAVKSKNIKNIIKEMLKSIKIIYLKNKKNIQVIKKIDSKYIITTRDFHNKLVGKYADNNIIKIATEHNYHNDDTKYINKVIKSVKNFDYFIVVSNDLKEYYQDKVGNTECLYIPNIIDELPNKKSNLKDNIIVNVGRLENEKGHFELIEVVKEIKKEIKNIKLYLIGDGSLRKELEKKVVEYDLKENIIFTGFLSKKEMEKYLLKSKMFVMTSYTESFGLVLIEAMSYGIPCVAFDSANGAKNLLKNNVGILIKNREISKMAKTIIETLKDNKSLNNYSKEGYKKCQEYLSCNVKEQWIDLLNRSHKNEKIKKKTKKKTY